MKSIYPALLVLAMSLALGACAVDAGGSLDRSGLSTHGGAQLGTDHQTGVGGNASVSIGKDGLNGDFGAGLSVGGQDIVHLGNMSK